jgi:replication-associated recombination protein RarA
MNDNPERGSRGRFAPGTCGNPKGRPRKDRSISSAILKAATATVTATENGRRRKITKIDATAAQLANKGASGDIRAGKMLLDMAAKAEAQQESVRPDFVPLSQSDQEIAEQFLAEFRRRIEAEGGAA